MCVLRFVPLHAVLELMQLGLSQPDNLQGPCAAGRVAANGGQMCRDLVAASAPAGLCSMLRAASSSKVHACHLCNVWHNADMRSTLNAELS